MPSTSRPVGLGWARTPTSLKLSSVEFEMVIARAVLNWVPGLTPSVTVRGSAVASS